MTPEAKSDMRIVRYVKVFEKKRKDNYEQIEYFLTVDDFYTVKKFSKHAENGKYLCELVESIRQTDGKIQAERTICVVETNKIVQKRSYLKLALIIVSIVVIGCIYWFL